MMVERYDEWWASVAHVLAPGSVGIVSAATFVEYVATNFLTLKYIFPGGHIPSLPHELASMRRHGLTLMEIENLWPHYRRTISEWRKRFDERWLEIRNADPEFFDERFRRSWALYLDGTFEAFGTSLELSHIVFMQGRTAAADDPPTRAGSRRADFRTGDQTVECYR
jgi:cyclopropane-fatty-acyl-phospholipid synthase